MQAARWRWSGLSLLLLLVALLAGSRHAAGHSLAGDTREVKYEPLNVGDLHDGLTDTIDPGDESTNTIDPGDGSTNTTDPGDGSTDTTDPGDGSTDTTDPGDGSTDTTDPGDGSTDTTDPGDGSTDTTDPGDGSTETTDPGDGSTETTDTSDGSPPTTDAPTTEKPGTESTSDGSTPTDNTSTPTDEPNISTFAPLDELGLYERTQDELDDTEETLGNFRSLAESTMKSTEGIMGSPAGWWKVGKEQTEEVKPLIIDDFCNSPLTSTCEELKTDLTEVQKLVTILNINVDAWTMQNLGNLVVKNNELNSTYQFAITKPDDFKNSINSEKFLNVIDEIAQEVKTSENKVSTKINDIKKNRTGSVVLVAVIGSLGGIMIVSLAGVMVYSATKKQMKKKSSATPYNKLQGENIPIDAFLSDGPPTDVRQVPRADPYTNQPPPGRRGDPYASSYGGRSEPMPEYRGQPRVTRVGKGLPRTHF